MEFFGLAGWFDSLAYQAASRLPEGQQPAFGWSILYLAGANESLIRAIYWASISVLVAFTAGLVPRLTAVLTWIIVVSFTANPASVADLDPLVGILAFYLMVGYVLLPAVDDEERPLERWTGPLRVFPLARPMVGDDAVLSPAPAVALGLLQVHGALVVLVNGLHKLQFGEWWSGVALWYPLHPVFSTPVKDVRISTDAAPLYLGTLSLLAYATIAWQITFPLFAWNQRARAVLLGGGLLGWIGSIGFYGTPLFGGAIFIICLSFLSASEWARVLALLSHLPGLQAWSGVRERGASGKYRDAKRPTAIASVTTGSGGSP
jgi:hypothetical protein